MGIHVWLEEGEREGEGERREREEGERDRREKERRERGREYKVDTLVAVKRWLLHSLVTETCLLDLPSSMTARISSGLVVNLSVMP